MGKISEDLSAGERESIFRRLVHSAGQEVEKVDSRGLWTLCPMHNEETASFYYSPEKDKAKCFGCGEWTDIVGVFNAFNGRPQDDKDGAREFREKFCDGSAISYQRKEERPKRAARWVAQVKDAPPVQWQRKAGEFVEDCHAELLNNPKLQAQREQLLGWGIDTDCIKQFRIGWNPKMQFRKVTHWGLPHRPSGKDKAKEGAIILPAGFVFPVEWDGALVRMQIRVSDVDQFTWIPKEKRAKKVPKYYDIEGSWKETCIFGDAGCSLWMVMETIRDGMLSRYSLQHLGIGVMSLGGATNQPGTIADDLLRPAELIMVATDNDMPGARASLKFEPDQGAHMFGWLNEYPQAIRWLVPKAIGKDVGDLPAAGVSVWDWFSAGLPSHVLRRLESKVQQLANAASLPEGEKKRREIAQRIKEAPLYLLHWPVPDLIGDAKYAEFFRQCSGLNEVLIEIRDGEARFTGSPAVPRNFMTSLQEWADNNPEKVAVLVEAALSAAVEREMQEAA